MQTGQLALPENEQLEPSELSPFAELLWYKGLLGIQQVSDAGDGW